jgi:hypothetical protein
VHISLIKRGLQPASREGQQKAKRGLYNCAPKVVRQVAPAESQSESSCLTLQTRLWTGNSLRLKTRQFRSFQISQLIRSARQHEALQLISCREVIVTHHSNGVEDVGQAVGCRSGSPIQMAISFQTRRVKRQSASKWCVVSIVCLQRGQTGLWSQPLRSSLSLVHTRSWRMSHAKNLHWGGGGANFPDGS